MGHRSRVQDAGVTGSPSCTGGSSSRESDELVVPLGAVDGSDGAIAGGKAANLGELVRAGFPVPDGFVVTTHAYARVVGARGHCPEESVPGDDGSGIRARIEAVALPSDLRAMITSAYAALGGGAVAVRSSATAEDLPGAAFAGQQDTYLGVLGEDAVVDAVRRCWASLWTDRAIAYRRRLGIDPAQVRLAVVVQRMVDAEAAGVVFTADPVTGDRERIVVEASSGLGEAVVSGAVTPDRYVLDTVGGVREQFSGRREVVIRTAPGGGTSHEERAESTAPAAQLLPDDVLAELTRLGTAVASHFGRPQDIEWACAQGRVWLLQARPMTALPPPPVHLGRAQRMLAAILLEYLPVRPYPIDMSTWLPHGPAGLMAQVTAYFGIRSFEDFLVEEDGVVTRLTPPAPRPTLAVIRAPWRLLTRARRYDPRRWTEDPRLAAYLGRGRDLAAEDLSVLAWGQLLRVPQRALNLVHPVVDLRIDYLPRAGLALVRLLVVLHLLRRAGLMSDLVLGAPTRTTDANRALEALAAGAREDHQLLAAVTALDLEAVEDFPDFSAALRAFLDEYGHRETTSPLLVTPPTWADSPKTVLGLLVALTSAPPARAAHHGDALDHLLTHPLLRSPRLRARVRDWIEQARAGIAFREDSHFYFTVPLPVLRRSLLEIGRRLCAAGVLSTAEEVFHLRLEELEGVEDPGRLSRSAAEELRALVRARAARREELTGVPLINPGAVFVSPTDGDALVSGTPAGGGVATGAVRIVSGPSDFTRLREGEVLVCPYTNPSWTPLFQRAAAVVVDTGGLGSHAAIVAREYGIPAVMGTGTGTATLTDGLVVTVDGTTGRVVLAASRGA